MACVNNMVPHTSKLVATVCAIAADCPTAFLAATAALPLSRWLLIIPGLHAARPGGWNDRSLTNGNHSSAGLLEAWCSACFTNMPFFCSSACRSGSLTYLSNIVLYILSLEHAGIWQLKPAQCMQ